MTKSNDVDAPAAGALPTGVVTFLLSDVVGSTKMWEDAPDLMTTALARHDSLIREAVESHGGVLLKARGEGDSTFNVFGRATDAVAAARAIQAALTAEPWPERAVIAVRAAVHTGEAIERDGDYFGRSVNRVARLRSLAEAGQVLVSQATADLVIDHLPSEFRLVDLGVRELRDLARPEVVYLVAESDSAPAGHFPRGHDQAAPGGPDDKAIPLPARLGSQRYVWLAGRDADGDALRRHFDLAAAGERQVVLIAGEPGIGKTTLAAAAAVAAHARGATVLLGRCEEDVGLSYRPWIEALSHLVVNVSKSVLDSVGPRMLADLAGLIADVRERCPYLPAREAADADYDRFRLFAAVSALIAAASENAPVVLVMDDLQWADKPSLVLLRHLLGSSDPMRLLVIGTFREGELATSPALSQFVASVHREVAVERLALRGLDDTGIIEMVQNLAGHELDSEQITIAREIRRETDGNPFFVQELLRHLVESGLVFRQDDNRWGTSVDMRTAGLPQSVRDVVGQRVARLGTAAQNIMRLASVIGQDFDLDLLAAASGHTELELVELLELAEAAALVIEYPDSPGRFSFAHALVQQTLYEEFGTTRRQLAHREVAEALEALYGADPGVHIVELAQQWMAAARPSDLAKAIGYARSAGDAAVAALAPDEASRWYGHALRLLDQSADPDVRTRLELLIALGSAQRHGGEQTLMDAARLARAGGNPDALVKAVLANTGGWQSRSVVLNRERPEMIEAALEAVGPADSSERAMLLKLRATELAFQRDSGECQAWYAEALAMARRLGHKVTLLEILLRGTAGFWTPDSLDQRLALSREAFSLAREVGGPDAEFWAYYDLAKVTFASGLRDEYDAAMARVHELAKRFGTQPALWALASRVGSGPAHTDARLAHPLDWVLTTAVCADALQDGELARAEEHAQHTFELSTSVGRPSAPALLALQLGLIRSHRGRERDSLEVMEQATVLAPHLLVFRVMLVRACLDAGQQQRARDIFDEVVAGDFRTPWDVNWLIVMCWWSEVAVRLGDTRAARPLYDRLAPWHAQVAMVSVMSDGSVNHYLGVLAALLGDTVAAEAHFARALEVHLTLKVPFHTARTQLELGRLLAGKGDAIGLARAQELLRSATETASRYGYETIARDATSLRDALPKVFSAPSER